MAALAQAGKPPSPPGVSERGEGVHSARAITTEAGPSSNVGGRARGRDPRKFDYAESGRPIGTFTATREDRLSAGEACAALALLHKTFVPGESEEHWKTFDSALFLCHALNSGSVLNTGRAKLEYVIDARKWTHNYREVLNVLALDVRRFFRAYADDIRTVIKQVLATYDPYDFVSVEIVGQVKQIAGDRGLSRFPDLIFDAADACLQLTPTESAAVRRSKSLVLRGKVNVADELDFQHRGEDV